jgi:hypothetical protein
MACKRRRTASARASLPLPAAPDAQRFGFFIFKAFWRNPEVGEDYGGVPAQIHHV